MEWFIYTLQQFNDFKSRSRRQEYWRFMLFYILLAIGAHFLDSLFGFASVGDVYGPIYALYIIIMFLPALAVSVRRLHDVDKSGWWLLLGFIPIIGTIWLLIYFLREGTYGPNRYGADPKEELR